MSKVFLSGCRPDTVVGYLKALGILRLVGEQKDPSALGWWSGEEFTLESSLDDVDLTRFLLEEYHPSPVLTPWNKDSGFYRPGSALETIEQTADSRLAEMRKAIKVARGLLDRFGWHSEPGSGRDKERFLASLRAELPDSALRWFDAVVALAGDRPAYPPLFGTGGVDGRFEMARVFAECLIEALGAAFGVKKQRRGWKPAKTESALRASLFASLEADSTIEATGGLLAPASGDVPNAALGFLGSKRLNPWDFILAIEGALVLAGSVARRHGPAPGRLAIFPFTVEGTGAGHASAGNEGSRGEVWLPLWGRPATLGELLHLFREGRAEWRRRQATSASDMARAIVGLGVDRGLSEFRRFGVQGRSGRSYIVTPLGRWPVVDRPEVQLLAELDVFLASLRSAAQSRDAPNALVLAWRSLEAAIMEHAAYGGRDRLTRVLIAAAKAELTVARRPRTRERGAPPPLSGLSSKWIAQCDDGSAEFELAAAVASLQPAKQGPGELRQHLEPLERSGSRWIWSKAPGHEIVWTGRDLVNDLCAILQRRILDAGREGIEVPLDGCIRASPQALGALLRGEVNLDQLATLIEALALLDIGPQPGQLLQPRPQRLVALPPSYAMIKLTLLGRPLKVSGEKLTIRPDPMVVGLLRAGDVWEATLRAARRLRAAGVTPRRVFRRHRDTPVTRDDELGRRFLAALVVPVAEEPLLRAIGHCAAY